MKLKTWNSNNIEYGNVRIYQPWIIFYSWYCVRRLISLHCIILLDADFQFCSIQVLSNTFAYLVQVIWIATIKTSLHSTLAYMSKGMDPTPHVIMPRSWRMWLEVDLTNVGLGTSGASHKTTWSLSHFKFVCLPTLIISFYSLWQNQIKGLFKTYAFMTTWCWCLGVSS
jgi:hypothetical protein